ncbi:MAG: hypothetical protein AABY07_03640 [Nanoarchaeota archaeon]
MILSEEVLIGILKPKQVVRFRQTGSDYVHKALLRGVADNNGSSEALFVYRSFSDDILRTFSLPIVDDNGSRFIDFSSVDFRNGVLYYGFNNGFRNDYSDFWNRLVGDC